MVIRNITVYKCNIVSYFKSSVVLKLRNSGKIMRGSVANLATILQVIDKNNMNKDILYFHVG